MKLKLITRVFNGKIVKFKYKLFKYIHSQEVKIQIIIVKNELYADYYCRYFLLQDTINFKHALVNHSDISFFSKSEIKKIMFQLYNSDIIISDKLDFIGINFKHET